MTLGEMVERRRKSALDTRAAMLEAARQRFLRESYENVGLRDIARDVGVDVALVSRYFGSKEELFREVLRHDHGDNKFEIDVTPEELPAYLTHLFQEKDDVEDREHAERLIMVLRSASSPQAAAIGHDIIHNDVLDPLADLLGGGEEAQNRAGMAVLILLGGLVMRSIMCGHSDCDEPMPEDFRRRLLHVFRAAFEPLDAPAPSAKEPAEPVA